MTLKNYFAKLAIADAQRFERQSVDTLRTLCRVCSDPATKCVLEELVAEEMGHLRELRLLSPGQPSAVEANFAEATETVSLDREQICARLNELLAKEQASVTFYQLLADRTPIRSVKNIFASIAEAERGHIDKLSAHIREICGKGATAEGKP